MNTAAENIGRIGQFLKAAPALAMTPEQMAQRIAAAGSAARREDQAALAKAGEDKARVMADLRAIAGSAWTRAEQKNRQLWFGLGGVAIGIFVWAILPGLVAREVAPASWQWPEKMAARTLRLDQWAASQRLAAASQPALWNEMVTGGIIVRYNRDTIAACAKAAAKTGHPARCSVRIGQDIRQVEGRGGRPVDP